MTARSRSIATAVALLFITGGVVANADHSGGAVQVRCSGINSCKGQSFCATAKNACAGQNACKGQGWLKVSREECSYKGGHIMPDKDD
jgi:uncharacterized membrane protein